MKAKPIFTIFFLLLANALWAQVREYAAGGALNLTFQALSKARSGNLFVAGMQDKNIYVAEITPTGNVVREKTIETNNQNLRITSMITDFEGNIALVGIDATGNPTSFLMKISPALSLIYHKVYNEGTVPGPNNNSMYFSDIKAKQGTNIYYIAGSFKIGSDENTIILSVDKFSGNVIAKKYAQVNASTVQERHDALMIDTQDSIKTVGLMGNTTLSRPWVNNINRNNLMYTNTNNGQYILPTTTSAYIYAWSLTLDSLNNPANGLFCWGGGDNGVANYNSGGLVKFKTSNKIPIWQKKYNLTSSAPQAEFMLDKVVSAPLGMVVKGQYWKRSDAAYLDASGAPVGNLILMRTDTSGVPVWARQFKNVMSSYSSHNASVEVFGNYVYSVGYRVSGAIKKGVLVRVPYQTGAVDTACGFRIAVGVQALTHFATPSIEQDIVNVSSQDLSESILCLTSTKNTPCDSCITQNTTLNTQFNLVGQIVTNSNQFTLTASNYTTTQNSRFRLSEVNPTTLVDIATTITNDPGTWGSAATTQFNGYVGTNSVSGTAIGNFIQGKYYRVRHYLSGTNKCNVDYADSTAKIITMIQSSRGVAARLVELSEMEFSQIKSNDLVYPNPADQSVQILLKDITFGDGTMELQSMDGRKLTTQKILGTNKAIINTANLPAGMYFYKATSKSGQVQSGKIQVQH